MSDEDKSQKTEPASQRKLDEARKKGESPKSQEISGWFVMAAGLVVIVALFQPVSGHVSDWLRLFLAQPDQMIVEASTMIGLLSSVAWRVVLTLGAVFGVITGAAVAGHLVQAMPVFTGEKIKPKLDKISPVEGAKKMFGAQGLVNFLKGVGKIVLVAVAAFAALWPRRDALATLPAVDLAAVPDIIREAAIALMLAALIVYALIAAADYAWQKHSFMEKQKMSKREQKEEFKNTEGDPHVRAKLRQIRMEKGRKRMLAQVPEATVVIANPTHFAVALKYERGETPAPLCLAKGVDEVALRIRKLAEKSGVPVIEDPPLARALHATAELDEVIPEEHFQAVAKVIGQILAIAQSKTSPRGS